MTAREFWDSLSIDDRRIRMLPAQTVMREMVANGEWGKIVSKLKTGKCRGPLSLEWRMKISASLKGRPKSEEHKRKISVGIQRYLAKVREATEA